jgi:hypothetical protein
LELPLALQPPTVPAARQTHSQKPAWARKFPLEWKALRLEKLSASAVAIRFHFQTPAHRFLSASQTHPRHPRSLRAALPLRVLEIRRSLRPAQIPKAMSPFWASQIRRSLRASQIRQFLRAALRVLESPRPLRTAFRAAESLWVFPK